MSSVWQVCKRGLTDLQNRRDLFYFCMPGVCRQWGTRQWGAGRGAIQWKQGERIIPSEQHIPLPPQENYQAPFPPSLGKAPQD